MKEKRIINVFWMLITTYLVIQSLLMYILKDKTMVFFIYIILWPITTLLASFLFGDPYERIYKYLNNKREYDPLFEKIYNELYPLGKASLPQKSNLYKYFSSNNVTDDFLIMQSRKLQRKGFYGRIHIVIGFIMLILLYVIFRSEIHL